MSLKPHFLAAGERTAATSFATIVPPWLAVDTKNTPGQRVYDAVIIGHSQFERIPLSYERQERIIQEQIDETLAAIEELKANVELFFAEEKSNSEKTQSR